MTPGGAPGQALRAPEDLEGLESVGTLALGSTRSWRRPGGRGGLPQQRGCGPRCSPPPCHICRVCWRRVTFRLTKVFGVMQKSRQLFSTALAQDLPLRLGFRDSDPGLRSPSRTRQTELSRGRCISGVSISPCKGRTPLFLPPRGSTSWRAGEGSAERDGRMGGRDETAGRSGSMLFELLPDGRRHAIGTEGGSSEVS